MSVKSHERYVRSTEMPVYEWDRIQLEDALSTLTEREKGIYLIPGGTDLHRIKFSNI